LGNKKNQKYKVDKKSHLLKSFIEEESQMNKNMRMTPRDCRQRKCTSQIAEYEKFRRQRKCTSQISDYENFRTQGNWSTNCQVFKVRTAPICVLPIPVGNMKMEPAALY